MAEVAAPVVAPATNGVQTSAPAAPPAARNNAGQFSPKDGATGVTPPAQPPKPSGAAGQQKPVEVEKKAEPFRFKRKLDNEEVDLDETALERELKELRWRRKQQNEVTTMRKEAEELVRLAQTDEDAFFKKMGVDVDARAERKIAERLRLSTMTPEQQELERARAELEAEKKGLLSEKQRIAETQKQAQRAQLQQQNRQEYEQALGHSALPHSRAKLFLMTQIQRGQVESGAGKLSPEHLGRAYDEMMFSAFDEMVRSASTKPEAMARWPDLPRLATASLEKLDGAALLQALGPALKRRVLEASVAEHRGQQTIPVQQRHEETPPPTSAKGPIDEVEAERRKREFLSTFK